MSKEQAERLKAWQSERLYIEQQPAVEINTPAARTWRREDLYQE